MVRLTRGNYYDYREGTGNVLVMNSVRSDDYW
jgi:hypothetical protein